jgi:hypothetical protein
MIGVSSFYACLWEVAPNLSDYQVANGGLARLLFLASPYHILAEMCLSS